MFTIISIVAFCFSFRSLEECFELLYQIIEAPKRVKLKGRPTVCAVHRWVAWSYQQGSHEEFIVGDVVTLQSVQYPQKKITARVIFELLLISSRRSCWTIFMHSGG